jgi:hypothetical protein
VKTFSCLGSQLYGDGTVVMKIDRFTEGNRHHQKHSAPGDRMYKKT